MVLEKKPVKENSATLFILTKNYGMLKCFVKGVFQAKSKNLGLLEPGNLNRFFILTNLESFRIISALPLKIVGSSFYLYPYQYLWTLKIIKNLNLIETPNLVWFLLLHLDDYLKQSPRNFPYWFLFHLLKELGYGINLETCQLCQRKLKKFAFFDNKRFLYCFYCKKDSYQKIENRDLEIAKKIENLIKVPKKIPNFLKIMIKNNWIMIK